MNLMHLIYLEGSIGCPGATETKSGRGSPQTGEKPRADRGGVTLPPAMLRE
jgi:hypothetical protein